MGNVQQHVGKRMTIGHREVEAVQYLGEGGSSFIFLVRDVTAGPAAPPLVLKRLMAHTESTVEWATSEIRLHKRLQHPQVVQFLDAKVNRSSRSDKSEIFILMEYCPGGHLQENMLKMGDKRFLQNELLRTFRSLCTPVAMLHAQDPPIAHRDLKLENFLRAKDGVYKLCDFGSCVEGTQSLVTKADRLTQAEHVAKRTTAMYRSPELADVDGTAMFGSGELTEAVDVWAMGCVLYSMAFFKAPFPLEGLRTDRYSIPKDSVYSPDVHQLIGRMLTADVDKRATIDEVLDCLDELLAGRALPKAEGSSRKKVRVSASKKSPAKASESATPGKKTEARKESVANKAAAAVDLLGMDFNPSVSETKASSQSNSTPPPAFGATWTTTTPTDGFADFANFPSPTSAPSGGSNASGASTDPFSFPASPVKGSTSPAPGGAFGNSPTPSTSWSSPPPNPTTAVSADPFEGLDAPPAPTFGGFNYQQQQRQQAPTYQHLGFQQQQQQQQQHQHQQQYGYASGFPVQQPYQQQYQQPFQHQQPWGSNTAANHDHRPSNPF